MLLTSFTDARSLSESQHLTDINCVQSNEPNSLSLNGLGNKGTLDDINSSTGSDETFSERRNQTHSNSDVTRYSSAKRVRTKYPCYYCGVNKVNLKDHLFKVHKLETRIENIMKLDKNEQTLQIGVLKNEGIVKFNMGRQVENQMAARKRIDVNKCLVTCPNCLKSLTKRCLNKHVKICNVSTEGIVTDYSWL